MGCKSEPKAAPSAAEAASLEPAAAQAEPSSSVAEPVASAPVAAEREQTLASEPSEDKAAAGTCAAGTKHEQYKLAVGQRPGPKQMPNYEFTFDANGCASAADVDDNCRGIHLLSGPVRKGGQCLYSICRGREAPCGRLLLDASGEARVAPLVASGRAPAGSDMPAAARAGWLQDARLEHASVAAFARFSLELLSVGAPAEMVAEAHRAALDEIEHARLCFALAEAEVAPGPLSLRGIDAHAGLEAIVRATVEECCCGETFAALVAQRGLQECVHPAARAALERIAADEARHAELGWRFSAWAVSHFGVSARTAAAEGLVRGLSRLELVESATTGSLRDYGRLSSEDLQDVAREAAVLIRQLDASLDLQRA